MSRKQMMTFMEGRHLRENSSQRAASFGPVCRFTLTMTCFVSAIIPRPTPASGPQAELLFLLRRVVTPRTRLDQRNVDRFVCKQDIVVHPLRARGLQPIGVVALRKIRLVVRAARLIAGQRTKRDEA